MALRIAIAGAGGRMGRMLIEAVLDSSDCTLAGALAGLLSTVGGVDCGADSGAPGGGGCVIF